jgi:hypothetical protein
MSLNALFPDPEAQKYATTIIGLVSILSAVLITMNQYVKSQQMMEAHRAAALAYGKLHRNICNELAVRRDQRSNAIEFLKLVRGEQDRLESTSPSILPRIIMKFNRQFSDRQIEKPEIAGDLDETEINTDTAASKKKEFTVKGLLPVSSPISKTLKSIQATANGIIRNGSFQSSVTPESTLFGQEDAAGAVTIPIMTDISGAKANYRRSPTSMALPPIQGSALYKR